MKVLIILILLILFSGCLIEPSTTAKEKLILDTKNTSRMEGVVFVYSDSIVWNNHNYSKVADFETALLIAKKKVKTLKSLVLQVKPGKDISVEELITVFDILTNASVLPELIK